MDFMPFFPYISALIFLDDFPLLLIEMIFPFILSNANPSPPRPQRLFCVTARTALVAMAASAILPPSSRTFTPVLEA